MMIPIVQVGFERYMICFNTEVTARDPALRPTRILNALLFFLALTLCFVPSALFAVQDPSQVPTEVGVVEQLNQAIDLNLQFDAEDSKAVTLSELLLPGRPAIMVPVYYNCPHICGLTMKGVARLINSLDLTLGQDYSVITFSIDPSETPELAAKKARELRAQLRSNIEHPDAWHFLSSHPLSSSALAQQLGFRYLKDGKEFAHAAAIMVVTPAGKISRYAYGNSFSAASMRYALVEASHGAIGNALDRVFLYCFHYDDRTKQYTPIIMNLTRMICFGVLGLVILLIAILYIRERRGRHV